MDLILWRDTRHLMYDAERVQKDLEILEYDHAAWAKVEEPYMARHGSLKAEGVS